MTRARMTWIGVVLVALGATPAFADKPKVAILGVEVVGDGIDIESIKVGTNLTNALRVRPNANPNPYQIAPNSNKELADEKVIKSCGSEDPSCMAAIGNDLGADVLIYGKLEKGTQNNVKGYSAQLVRLNVKLKVIEKNWKDFIPNSETNADDIQKWAKAAYTKLTGNNLGGLSVKVENPEVDKGTVYVDGKVGDKLSSGRATLTGLSEGKHHIVIEVGGFKRFEQDVTIGPGETRPDAVTLEKDGGDNIEIPPKCKSDDPTCKSIEGTTSDPSTRGWKISAVVGGVATIGLAIPYGIYWSKLNSTGRYSVIEYGSKCVKTENTDGTHSEDYPTLAGNTSLIDNCIHGDRNKAVALVTGIGMVAAAGFTGYAIYRSLRTEHRPPAASGSARKEPPKPEVSIVPVITPTTVGTSFILEW
jgi:hypothetical protein